MGETWKDLAGHQLVFGMEGKSITDGTVSLFRETGARGLILYRRNYESPSQIKKLISDLENALGRRILVCVDHEGGRIIMFGGGVTVFPDNYCLGALADVELARRQGEIEGKELRAMGVDVNFSPVLDIFTQTYNPGILCRSYGKSPELVSMMGAARIKGMQSAGISATAKHYPGKGHATSDAHLKLPYIDSTIEEMESFHLKPFFSAIEAGADLIMSSHPCYRKIDADVPATFSRKIVGQFLRHKYGYGGVIVSDDLEMGAVKEVAGVEEAAVRAALAGHDMLLVCHTGPAQRKAQGALLKAYGDGTLKKADLEKSAERIKILFSKRKERFTGAVGPLPEGEKLAVEIAGKSAAVLQKGKTGLPFPPDFLKGGKIAAVFPRFSDISDKVMIEESVVDMEKYLRGYFSEAGFLLEPVPVGINPTEDEARKSSEAVAGADLVLVFCFDAGLYKGWEQILSQVQEKARECAVILMRDPYDMRFLSLSTVTVTGYGFRRCQLDAALRLLFSK